MNNPNTQSTHLDEEPLPAYAPPTYPPLPTDPQPSTSHPAAETTAPPAWETSAGESVVARLYPYGVYHDAGRNNYERGVRFVQMHPDIDPPQFIPLESLDLVRTQGPGAWTLTLPSRFDGNISRNRSGTTEVKSTFSFETDKTVLSSLPMSWGKYSPPESSKGVYYEVCFDKVGRDTSIAVGFGCLPYPTDFRLPGWHRQSAAVHSDDGHKFYENGDGGVPFTDPIKKGGTTTILP
jgi:Ran-binding protein 9/10